MRRASRSDRSSARRRGDRTRPPVAIAHRAAAPVAQAGFTLIEVLITMVLVVILLLAATQIMFQMQRGSERMSFKAEARATARRAIDYLALHTRNASDLARASNNGGAVMTWFAKNGTAKQATWNNVATAGHADLGTDILTLAVPSNGLSIPSITFSGWASSTASTWAFNHGCPDNAVNLQRFKEMTGESGGVSVPLVVTDDAGAWGIYQITSYASSDCSTANGVINVVANPAAASQLSPLAGNPALGTGITLKIGVKFVSFRVHDGWLEQKTGLFDPDAPDTGFFQLVPQVEDLQVAWVFNDGTIWNTAARQLDAATYTGRVPTQAVGNPYDAENVVGLNLTVVARSEGDVWWEDVGRYRRPAAGDRAEATTTDRFFHHSLTDLAMIRNRNLRR